MRKVFFVFLLSAIAGNLHASRRLFDYELREGDPRPKPNLTPAPSLAGKGESKGVRSKATGWVLNGICIIDTTGAAMPHICSDGKYGAILSWTESSRGWPTDTTHKLNDIYAQRVDSGGNVVWQSQGVPVCSLANTAAEYEKIIADGYGGAIIAWEENRDGLGYTRVFAQRLDSLGNRLWPENGVLVCNQMSGYVDLCSDGQGGAIIAYADGRDIAVTSDNIYAQRIDSAGYAVWAVDGVPVCIADSSQFRAFVTSNNNGGAIITWADDYRNNEITGRDVYAQMLDSLGNPKWTVNGETLCIASGSQRGRKAVPNNCGGGIIGWWDFGDSAGTYTQSLDSIAGRKWSLNGIWLYTYSYYLNSDNRGGGIWSNMTNVHRIDSLGNVCWGSGVALHDTLPSSMENHADADGFGGVIAIWNYSTHLYTQRVDSNGNVLWNTTGVPVCTTMNTNEFQQVTNDMAGGAIAAWYGNPTNGDNHIYVQKVYGDGKPGGVTGEPIQNVINGIQNIRIYPNPFSYSTKIQYSIEATQHITLNIYNIAGQHVKTLVNEKQPPGQYTVTWNGRNNDDRKAAAGIYFYRLGGVELASTKKIVIIR